MIIDEAIKDLKERQKKYKALHNPTAVASLGLGIEALERVLAYKKAHRGLHYTPLPSETEE